MCILTADSAETNTFKVIILQFKKKKRLKGKKKKKYQVQSREQWRMWLSRFPSQGWKTKWVTLDFLPQAVRSLGCFKWDTFSRAFFFGIEIMVAMCKMNRVRQG